jgi:hypothetical protein
MRGIDSGDGEDNVVPDDDLPNGNNDVIYSNGIGICCSILEDLAVSCVSTLEFQCWHGFDIKMFS